MFILFNQFKKENFLKLSNYYIIIFIKLLYILDNKLLKMKLHRYLKANPLKLALLAHRGCCSKSKKRTGLLPQTLIV